MKIKLLFILLLVSVSSFAQYTLIPDTYFETELISQGIDSGTPDGKVLTSKINTLTTLNVRASNIKDLTGIQDFTALKSLFCDTNQLTALDVSRNTALTYLSFGDNYLTVVDVSKNTALIELRCYHNQLAALDVSKNTALITLYCYENQLKTLDVSKNTALTYFNCSYNQLAELNLKNGNNSKLSTNSLFYGNNLSCIQVDNVAYANANWGSAKDDEASYNTDCSAVIQYTLIPDVNFEKMLILLGYDFGTSDGKVPTSKISGVTSLDISGRSISNLTGIQDFVALQSLNCSSNQLKALDFSKNTALTSLVCNSNQLATLDVSKNVALQYLQCYSNQLTVLDVSNNTALKQLSCYSNQLTTLDVSNNTALTYLHCYSNQLTSLNVSQNVSLTELKCYSNNLTSFDVSKSIVLTKLYCYSNQLTALDVSKNIALIELYCYSNQLTALDISKNTTLKYIDCSSNQLTGLNLKNGNNTNFSTYKFTNNPNLSCIQVDNDYYSNSSWKSYKDATASYNKDCLTYTLIPDVNFEKKLISLGIDSATVDGQVPTYKINTLTDLDVSNSSIADLSGIQGFVGLYTLNCSGNQLTALDVSKNKSIYSLNCSSNQLTSLNLKTGTNTYLSTRNFKNNPNLSCIQVDDFSYSNKNWVKDRDATANYSIDCSVALQFTLIPDVNFEKELISQGIDLDGENGKVLTASISSLTFLDTHSNNITDLTGIQDFTSLHTFYCIGNQLTTLDLSKNTALESLMCESNKLTSLDVSKNTALRFLSCINNQLTVLDVSKNTALEQLVCYSNKLTALDVSKNTALINLLCYNNQLTSLNLKNGKNVKLSNRDFKTNPNLSCIQVDDVAYSNANWATAKDATASYSEGCPPYIVAVSSAFEDKLIALGVDKDGKNGSVLFASITNVTSLDVSNSGITSLSGIEYFSKLETLNCQGNLLTSIDLSSNLALKYLDCSNNPLSALDVSKNTQLTELYCDGIVTITKKINAKTSVTNQLTALDVSKNLALTKLSCSNNQIVSLDLSKNTLLTDVNCSNNKLTSLNLNNGNNSKLVNINLKTNAALSCIQVDDVAYANTNWSTAKDATAIYSKTTCTLGIEDLVFNKIAIYPNPTKGELHIDNIVLEKASVYDALGKLVTATKFTNGSNTNSINLSGFPKGIYYVYLETEGSTTVRKIIVD
ncbi:T9SS type A sorting domain-containing protein [Flavobacterium sp. MC2016-06]|uniref:T9SS type A sorting domain-containing protein n=1 Tax=Flavobacterium sp. MC2016-06 TaxID=2676308 RepID=UPI0012BA89DC|nr:T9SS type A sorting domain-containing protein [Flavobacterium sp. MC2016-06]MBU3857720.1 T9SS type A sorting domain-containing protein [Flavobacterium sp. MC2016-06]